ncbi:MAG: N-acetylglucosamine-6-phosphate deacetylase, partial [Gemmataceae bacterium]
QAEWLVPPLFEWQINGCIGHAFSSPTLNQKDVCAIAAEVVRHGVGSFCPTLITASHETLHRSFSLLSQMVDSDPNFASQMPAFHLEGPYISPEDGPRGAHPRNHVRPPSLDEFHRLQDAARGRIRMVTLAPEHQDTLPFIEKLVAENVVVAIGHTAATPQRIREAIHAGATVSTHLGNGCGALIHRHENVIWEQLADDELTAGFIPDGHHLPPSLIRCLLRVKTPARLVLTCDASGLAGLPPGTYSLWDQSVEVREDGALVIPGTPYLAGSGSFTDDCLRYLLSLGEVSLADALEMASVQPRERLKLPPVGWEIGSSADLILFDHNEKTPFQLKYTILRGEERH